MTISTAAQKISDAAVIHFAEKGYDAGSLNSIAEVVGIRKPTVYSHFKNKDELYLYVFNEAIKIENDFAESCFTHEQINGQRYLSEVALRYQKSAYLRLIVRTAFNPPTQMKAQVSQKYEAFLQNIRSLFIHNADLKAPSARELYADAYLGIIDSVYVELLYATPAAAKTRRKAMWHIFSQSAL